MRRQIDQGLFTELYIGRGSDVERHDMTEPFSQLLTYDVGPAVGVAVTESGETADLSASRDTVTASTVLATPLPHVRPQKEPDSIAIRSISNQVHLVPPTRFERATSSSGGKRSIH
jgi:hypothetical protein